MWPKFLKPTPVIYLVIEKIDPFIYLIDQNSDPFIYCLLIFIPIQILIAASKQGEKQQQQQQTNIIIKVSNRDARKDGPLIDIPHRKSRAIHILLCENMGPFVYFYLKIEAYSYTGEAEKGGGTSLLCHI